MGYKANTCTLKYRQCDKLSLISMIGCERYLPRRTGSEDSYIQVSLEIDSSLPSPDFACRLFAYTIIIILIVVFLELTQCDQAQRGSVTQLPNILQLSERSPHCPRTPWVFLRWWLVCIPLWQYGSTSRLRTRPRCPR